MENMIVPLMLTKIIVNLNGTEQEVTRPEGCVGALLVFKDHASASAHYPGEDVPCIELANGWSTEPEQVQIVDQQMSIITPLEGYDYTQPCPAINDKACHCSPLGKNQGECFFPGSEITPTEGRENEKQQNDCIDSPNNLDDHIVFDGSV